MMFADLPPSSCATRFTVSAAAFATCDAGARRAGERHHVDAGMRGHRRADGRAVAVDEIEDARRHARLVQDLREHDAR